MSDYETTTPEYRCAKLAFGQDTKLPVVLIGQCLDDKTLPEGYSKVALANNDFYRVVITSKKLEDKLAIAGLIEAEEKIFGLSSNDSKILDASDTTIFLLQLQTLGKLTTFYIYNGTADLEYPEAALFSLMFRKKAGSATWAYKSLNGVRVSNLSTENRSVLNSINGNYFVSMGGVAVILEGRTTKGEYIDIIQGLDWLTNNMKIKIANALL